MSSARMMAAITGKRFPACTAKSVRALAIAASDSKVLVIGALDGVFRSKNGGNSWEQISPAEPEPRLKNIESIAIDPKNPNVVYAGTWHLAWKTDDGGANWQHINKGMIDDSDVFSVIVDSTNPTVVFASACSGIYKSDSAGDLFRKIAGHSVLRAPHSRAEAGPEQIRRLFMPEPPKDCGRPRTPARPGST